LQFYQNIILET